jgi:hypothetical protein
LLLLLLCVGVCVARHREREKDGLDKIIKTPTQSHSVSFFFFLQEMMLESHLESCLVSLKSTQKNL